MTIWSYATVCSWIDWFQIPVSVVDLRKFEKAISKILQLAASQRWSLFRVKKASWVKLLTSAAPSPNIRSNTPPLTTNNSSSRLTTLTPTTWFGFCRGAKWMLPSCLLLEGHPNNFSGSTSLLKANKRKRPSKSGVLSCLTWFSWLVCWTPTRMTVQSRSECAITC